MPKLSTFALHLIFCYTVLKRKGYIIQMKTDKEIIKEQGKQIQEMEQYISALEKENALQRQLIEMLEKQNAVLQQHYEEYVDKVHQMMKDFEL